MCEGSVPHDLLVQSVLDYTLQHVSATRFTFASASPDNIKQWRFPDGNFLQNLTGHNSIINCLAVNSDNVLVSGGTSVGGLFVCLFVCLMDCL